MSGKFLAPAVITPDNKPLESIA